MENETKTFQPICGLSIFVGFGNLLCPEPPRADQKRDGG
jgi:hypothetical protein